jgi:hypothetical protein
MARPISKTNKLPTLLLPEISKEKYIIKQGRMTLQWAPP